MAISAALVKQLRERTGSGMMECKKALVECDGDIDAAADLLRKQGVAKADKKMGRVAAEGLIGVASDDRTVALAEINCETDFVAKDQSFIDFVDAVAQTVLSAAPADMAALYAAELPSGESVEAGRKALIAKIGENVNVRRFERVAVAGRTTGIYTHGARIVSVVVMANGDRRLARDIAMHVAASKPVCVNESDVPAAMLAKEREIFAAQAADSGKPPEIAAKMVEGRVQRFLKEVTLCGQPFVKEPERTVAQLLTAADAEVIRFIRMEVGEGIEKKVENFADEVMAQAGA